MKKIITLIIITQLINSQYVISQDSSKVQNLPGIKVTEKLLHTNDIDRLPKIQATEIYSGKKNEVISIGASTADLSTNNSRQLFGKVPGLSIWENDGSGIQTGIATRGLSPNRSWEFNVRQNGYDISSEVFGYPEAYYSPPTEALERIEIVRGAGALQYGPQFGGLLNYVTKKHLGNKPISIEATQTIGSYGLLNLFNAIGGKYKKISYYAYMHQRSADGWRDNSFYRTQTGSASLTYDISKKWQITAEYSRMNNVSQQAGGLTDNEFNENARQSHRERNWFSTPWNSGAVQLNFTPSKNTRFNLRVFGVLAERNSVGFTRPINVADTINTLLGTHNPRQVDRDSYRNYGAEIRGIHEYTLLTKKSALSGGIRAYTGQTLREQRGIGTTGMDYTMEISTQQNGKDFGANLTFETQNVAVFVENMFQLTDKLAITPGVRYEFIRAESSGYISPVGSANISERQNDRNILLVGIGAEYATSVTSNVYANVSQGFRPILFSELTPSATSEVIDPNLRDASGYNADIGFRGSLFRNNLKFDVGVFRLFYDNRVGTLSVDGVPFRTNIGASLSQGIESYLELNLIPFLSRSSKMNLSVFSNYSFVDARYTRWDNPTLAIEGKRVENAPTHILRTGLTMRLKGFAATLQYNYVSEVFTDALNTESPNSTATTGQLPAYSLIDLNVSYQLKEKYQFRAGINNLTDAAYATRRAGGYPGPGILPGTGRTFYLSIGFRL